MVLMYVTGRNVYELRAVPIKRIDVPVGRIEGFVSGLEHRNSAFTRSGRTIDPSLERSCSCARVDAN